MYERYLIRLESEALGLRFNLETGEAMIGGNYKLRQDAEAFIEEYFRAEIPHPVFIQGRKMRYTFKLSKKVFDAGLKRMKDNGLIEKVSSLGRIVR